MKTLSAYVTSGVRRWPRPDAAFGVSLIAYKTAADVTSKAVTLVVTVAAARALTAADFGVLALAMTTGWLLGVASDAGLPMYAATRVAQAHAAGRATSPIVRVVTQWRSRLALLAAACGAMVGAMLVPSAALLPFTLIVLHQVFGAMLDTIAHVYRGLGRTDIESTISLAHRGAIALGALTVLAARPSLFWLSLALVTPPALAWCISMRIARRLTESDVPVVAGDERSANAAPTATLTFARFRSDVAPLGLGVLLSALYFRIDVYFLERLHGVETVGAYNAAFRFVDALRLFPAAALAVAYPLLCAATDHRPVRRLSAVLLGASLMVTLAVYASAGQLLAFVYGPAFVAAGDALRVLALCLPLFFVNYALTHQLIAWDGQRMYLGIATAALVANVVANALLIPRGQMVGAAYATLLTEIVVCGGCLGALARR